MRPVSLTGNGGANLPDSLGTSYAWSQDHDCRFRIRIRSSLSCRRGCRFHRHSPTFVFEFSPQIRRQWGVGTWCAGCISPARRWSITRAHLMRPDRVRCRPDVIVSYTMSSTSSDDGSASSSTAALPPSSIPVFRFIRAIAIARCWASTYLRGERSSERCAYTKNTNKHKHTCAHTCTHAHTQAHTNTNAHTHT